MRNITILAVTLLLAGCVSGQNGPRNFEPRLANPSAVIAAEIAFHRLAQEKGQWTAFRQTAAKDAVMFVPQPVGARDWLNGRADPLVSVKWQAHKAFMSCDGKTGVTTGAAQWPDGRSSFFTTVWQYFERGPGNGDWKWVLDHGDFTATERKAGEMIETRVASCKGKAPASLNAPSVGSQMKMGFSRDQSLSWTWVVQPDGARTLNVQLWNGEASDVVILDQVSPAK